MVQLNIQASVSGDASELLNRISRLEECAEDLEEHKDMIEEASFTLKIETNNDEVIVTIEDA
jgi:hypothetical protein